MLFQLLMSTAPKRPKAAETKPMSTFALILAMMTGSISTVDFQNVLGTRTKIEATSQSEVLSEPERIRRMIIETGAFGKIDNNTQA